MWAYKSNKHDLNLLKTKGAKVKGVVVKVVNRKRGIDFKYQFSVNRRTYESWEKTYRTINLGDSIEIIYYQNDPEISKPALEIK